MDSLNPPAIIGEAVAGESAKRVQEVRKELERLNDLVLDSTFDIAELLAEVKNGNYYGAYGFETFPDYVEACTDMKLRKALYLVRIVNVSTALGIPRTTYETIKVSKLNEIFSLDPTGLFYDHNTMREEPLSDHIKRLIGTANDLTLAQIKEEVKRLKGLTGENELVWINMSVKRSVRDNVIIPARELARKKLGSAGKDGQGDTQEYSDGVCEEVIHQEFLNDPNNQEEREEKDRGFELTDVPPPAGFTI